MQGLLPLRDSSAGCREPHLRPPRTRLDPELAGQLLCVRENLKWCEEQQIRRKDPLALPPAEPGGEEGGSNSGEQGGATAGQGEASGKSSISVSVSRDKEEDQEKDGKSL